MSRISHFKAQLENMQKAASKATVYAEVSLQAPSGQEGGLAARPIAACPKLSPSEELQSAQYKME
jgi:hypothetical protein